MGETTHLVLGGEVLPTTHPPTHEPPEPSNMSEAMASSEAVHWKAAADEEFKSL